MLLDLGGACRPLPADGPGPRGQMDGAVGVDWECILQRVAELGARPLIQRHSVGGRHALPAEEGRPGVVDGSNRSWDLDHPGLGPAGTTSQSRNARATGRLQRPT